MERWFVRHGVAEDPDPHRWPDDRHRPLSDAGRAEVSRLGRLLARIGVRPDEVWCSPHVRARETAELLARTAGWPSPFEVLELAGEADIGALLARVQAGPERLALVGHTPSLSQLLARWLGCVGEDGAPIRLAPGAIAYVDGEPGAAALRWLLIPAVLP